MISIGIAVRMMIGPLPYAVAAARAAMVRPTEAAGADAAIPIMVSSGHADRIGFQMVIFQGHGPSHSGGLVRHLFSNRQMVSG